MEHLPAVEWKHQYPGAAWMEFGYGRGRPALTGRLPPAGLQLPLLLCRLTAQEDPEAVASYADFCCEVHGNRLTKVLMLTLVLSSAFISDLTGVLRISGVALLVSWATLRKWLTHQLLDAHAHQILPVTKWCGFGRFLNRASVLCIGVEEAVETFLLVSLVADKRFRVVQVLVFDLLAIAAVVWMADDRVAIEERWCGCGQVLLLAVQFIGGAARAGLLQRDGKQTC
ncbi:hypothetical protein E2C01_006049 [Portunus trituberculatus]|uniref:Uncharacterized protein n=1 Tax=Portunus trituberculatus TaxID=210409 RepID=A0A5B7CV86_PORTR|nr:hypothetical protein [Portunus trituberculatus]